MCYIDGDPSLRWRVQRSQPLKTKRATLTGDPFLFLVEAAGVELSV